MIENIRLPNDLDYTVDHEHKRVWSTFPDTSFCLGEASFTEEDRARARALGYAGPGDTPTWRMHAEHDLCHHLVAQALGWPHSQVLHLAAHGATAFPAGIYQTEERMAFLVARAANVGIRGLTQ